MSRGTDSTAKKTSNDFIGNRQDMPALMTLLSAENLRALTEDIISDLEAELRKFIIDVRNISDNMSNSSILSKKPLLQNLRNASIKLSLARDQLESRGKTPRYYQYLLACQEYLEKACEQYANMINENRNTTEQSDLTATKRDNTENFSIQEGTSLEVLTNIQQLFQQTYDLFDTEDEIWPDQCNQAVANLHSASQPIKGVLELLNDSLELPPGTLPLSYELMGKLYQLNEQVRTLTSLIISLRSLCQTKSKQAIKIRENIIYKLDSFNRTYSAILPHINLFINKYRFLKRKHMKQHNLTLIKTPQ